MMWAEADRSQKKRSSGEINSAMIVVVQVTLTTNASNGHHTRTLGCSVFGSRGSSDAKKRADGKSGWLGSGCWLVHVAITMNEGNLGARSSGLLCNSSLVPSS